MISAVKSPPIHSVDGTTASGSISGCRARIRFTRPSSFSFGGTARISRESAARAKIASSFESTAMLFLYRSASGATRSENSPSIRSISCRSFKDHCFRSFPISTTAAGSMNSVEPLPDWSCTSPGTACRLSARTGIT